MKTGKTTLDMCLIGRALSICRCKQDRQLSATTARILLLVHVHNLALFFTQDIPCIPAHVGKYIVLRTRLVQSVYKGLPSVIDR